MSKVAGTKVCGTERIGTSALFTLLGVPPEVLGWKPEGTKPPVPHSGTLDGADPKHCDFIRKAGNRGFMPAITVSPNTTVNEVNGIAMLEEGNSDVGGGRC